MQKRCRYTLLGRKRAPRTRACGKCESYCNGRLDRLPSIRKLEVSRRVPVEKEQELWKL